MSDWFLLHSTVDQSTYTLIYELTQSVSCGLAGIGLSGPTVAGRTRVGRVLPTSIKVVQACYEKAGGMGEADKL